MVWVETCRCWEEKMMRTTVSYREQGWQEGKKEEGFVEEDILEEVLCPNTHLAKKAACQNVVVKCT